MNEPVLNAPSEKYRQYLAKVAKMDEDIAVAKENRRLELQGLQEELDKYHRWEAKYDKEHPCPK